MIEAIMFTFIIIILTVNVVRIALLSYQINQIGGLLEDIPVVLSSIMEDAKTMELDIEKKVRSIINENAQEEKGEQ